MKTLSVFLLSAILAHASLATPSDEDVSASAEVPLSSEEAPDNQGRTAVIEREKTSSTSTSSSSNQSKATKLNMARPAPVVRVPVAAPAIVVQPVMQPALRPAPRPVVQKQIVSHLGVPQNHIDVIPMSGGMYAVAVDDLRTNSVHYLALERQITLQPQQMYGMTQYVLPCQDNFTGRQTFVHAGAPNGHLILSDVNIGGNNVHGILGWDHMGQVVVPVRGQGAQMFVEPTVYRVQNLNTFSHSFF